MHPTRQIESNTLPLEDSRSFLWLILAGGLLAFANGATLIPIAAWLGPLFMVRFLRTRKPLPGLAMGYLVNAAAFYVQWRSAFLDAGKMFGLYAAAFGLIVYLPYVVDRLLRPRIGGFTSSLILPLAWVATEYALHIVLPLGTFFSMAYTQHMALPLLQMMSVTGMWGVTFLVLWFAGIVNYAWEGGLDRPRVRWGLFAYGLVLMMVLFLGGLRLMLAPSPTETVQVAVLTTNIDEEVIPDESHPLHQRLMDGALTAEDRRDLMETMAAINDDLLARTRRQARAGSRIVTWTEYNAHVFKAEEADFLARCRAVAREEGIYLVFPLITIQMDPDLRPERNLLVENKSVMITPEGEIAYEYMKANLLIGWEMEHAVQGERAIPSVETPYGTLASVICLDMDFPNFMRQAGQQGVDIVLSGAIDGTPSSQGNPMHAIMASYRAIESGFSLARGGAYAQNLAVDYLGRVQGRSDYYAAENRTAVAHLPVAGARTVYTWGGDIFPWLCMAGLAAMIGYALYTIRNK